MQMPRRPPEQIGMQPYRRQNNANSRPIGYDNRGTNRSTSRPPAPPPNQIPKAFLPLKPEIKITHEMQITDGRHRGVKLKHTLSPKIRLTPRIVREALFNVLGKRVRFSRFLDLCAGSGAVGVEAVSRGAALCTFVERSAKMCHFIKLNLDECKICPTGHGEIAQIEAVPFLKRMAARQRRWDIIYFDPPYEADYEEVLAILAHGACLRKEGGILIIEHHAEMFFPPVLGKLVRRKFVREGEAALTFYERVK